VRAEPVWVGELEPRPPGAPGHLAAVAACRERIAAGEIFQANLCLRLEGRWAGDPHDLFARAAGALEPRQGALVAGPWGAVCSLSPELFLRREGRRVATAPIKGTAPGESPGLATSPKERAENVMIVDLMRNDLGRVCEYGSVAVSGLTEPKPGAGVWHLVSTVMGTLRPGVGDAELLRASFPPGSVTGAPKIQSMRVIAELEPSGREVYTGAIGYASPLAGLELNVAIRTLELRGERIWLGVGGGIVADSDPARELEECFVKARPVVAATGGGLREGVGTRARPGASRAAVRRRSGEIAAPARPGASRVALRGGADRPDPAHGVFSTLLVVEGAAVEPDAHLARLRRSVREVYAQALPDDLALWMGTASAAWRLGRLRVLARPGPGAVAAVQLESEAIAPPRRPSTLAPVVLPGGLGEHKWRDRRLLAELGRRCGAVPLLVDADGEVLEAAHANLWIVEGTTLLTPPLDGRLLPGTARAQVLAVAPEAGFQACEEALTLERLAEADELLLTSSLRGVQPAALVGADPARFERGARLWEAMLDQGLRLELSVVASDAWCEPNDLIRRHQVTGPARSDPAPAGRQPDKDLKPPPVRLRRPKDA